MQPKDPKIIVEGVKSTLENNAIDFETIINNLGQVEASKKRNDRIQFTINDHLRALILAMLSVQRPWKPIMENMDKIDEIFYFYDPNRLEKADSESLITEIKAIKCGNRSINYQMKHLSDNIKQLQKIELEYGSLDNFVMNNPPEKVAKMLHSSNSEYELKGIGPALAMEYLKSVGIASVKPDLHIIRICGPGRLDIIPEKNSEKQFTAFKEFAKKANLTSTYLDNLFWIFGAKNFGEICSINPKCEICELKEYCNYI